LSDTGRLFTAPAGIYPDSGWIAAEVGRGGAATAVLLAQFLREASKDGALPARLVSAEFRSPDEGWELSLADKTKVLWGAPNRTRMKISRLKEVLADARVRGRANWSA